MSISESRGKLASFFGGFLGGGYGEICEKGKRQLSMERDSGLTDLRKTERGDGDSWYNVSSASRQSSESIEDPSSAETTLSCLPTSGSIVSTGTTTAIFRPKRLLPINASKLEVVSCDMPLELREFALEVISREANNVREYREVAERIKSGMDSVWVEEDDHWQCVVGHSFGSSVTHELHFFILATAGTLAVLIFKAAEAVNKHTQQAYLTFLYHSSRFVHWKSNIKWLDACR